VDVGALDELEPGADELELGIVVELDEFGAVGELVEFEAPDMFAPGVVTELLELPVPLGRLVELEELAEELFGVPPVELVELFD
jgi:hypothetical protein